MSYWTQQLRRWFGNQIPDDYLTFDFETTGLKRDYDLPIDFGYTLVRDRKMVTRKSFLLDWESREELMEPGWLASRLGKIRKAYAARGDPYHYSTQRLAKEGKDPVRVLQFIHQLFTSNRKAGAGFAGHNAAFFDCEMARSCFWEYLGEHWIWRGDEVFDTGAMEKALECARKLEPHRCAVPTSGESMYDFFVRTSRGRRAGIFWNIKKCVERYQLDKRFGVDLNALHGAKADSYVCHLLIEEYRNGRLDPTGNGPG